MIKIKYSQFRKLEPSNILIKDIYPAYRSWWNESEQKTKSYVYFPDSITKDVYIQWESEIDYSDKDTTKQHLRLQEWDDELKKFKFTKVSPPTRDFFQMYKKVYDVDVVLNKPVTVEIWDRETRWMAKYIIDEWEEVRLIALPAKKIQDIASSMMLTKWIEKVEVETKDRVTWEVTKTKKLPFNWEDGILWTMVGKAFEFAVEWEKLETKYSFREVPAFEPRVRDNTLVGDIEEGWMPF